MTITYVDGVGVSSSNQTVASGDTVVVEGGGSISNYAILSGGVDMISGGGVATGTKLSSSGLEQVLGGAATGTTVAAGGSEVVGAGGVTTNTQVASGGFELVSSGGTASGTTVASGGFLIVLPGASAANAAGTVVSTGVFVESAGTPTSATTISGVAISGNNAFNRVDVLQGGTASGTTVTSGGIETIHAGGSAVGTTVVGGSSTFLLISSGGTATGTVLSSGGLEFIFKGGTASGTTVGSGSDESIFSGGTASGTMVASGGRQVIDSGGTAVGTTVASGGVQGPDGGTASGTFFAAGGALDLDSVSLNSGETAGIDGSGVLTVTSGGHIVYSQQLASADIGYQASIGSDLPPGTESDGGPGTLVTITCFATGTRIRTARGDVAVEELALGDLAATASGGLRPITWIGHRAMVGLGNGRTRALPHDQQPIRIRQGAFGSDTFASGLPRRDLWLSPGHPVLVGASADGEGGHLVPVMCLINGTTVERMPVASITYWHVELDSHDILLAEGLPAESYLDWGDRAFFSEAPLHALADPDVVAPGLAGRCRPVALDGPVVEAERRRLDAVFAAALAAQCTWVHENGGLAW